VEFLRSQEAILRYERFDCGKAFREEVAVVQAHCARPVPSRMLVASDVVRHVYCWATGISAGSFLNSLPECEITTGFVTSTTVCEVTGRTNHPVREH